MKTAIRFLKKLKSNNNKEWFDAHRGEYTEAKNEFLGFVGAVLEKMKKVDPTLVDLEPRNCVFRINRDVRFSNNKEPYKTNFGASFSKGAKKINCAGYYFHLEPGGHFIGGGFWMPEPEDLKKIRMEIDYNFDEFSGIVEDKKFKKLFGELSTEAKLSRPPKGYEQDNPALEFLKLKSFTVFKSVDEKNIMDAQLAKKAVEHFTVMKPFVDFLNRALD